jgi:hypothetical protein
MVNNAGNTNEGPAGDKQSQESSPGVPAKSESKKKWTNTLTTAPISQSNGGNATILV